jgi:hypothetical protein
LAQDLFFKKSFAISSAHGKFKGVMDLKSTNNIGDMMLVSCGNDDDSRILIHDLESRSVVKEIKKEEYGFYNMNMIVFEREEDNDEDDEEFNLLDINRMGSKKSRFNKSRSRSRSKFPCLCRQF